MQHVSIETEIHQVIQALCLVRGWKYDYTSGVSIVKTGKANYWISRIKSEIHVERMKTDGKSEKVARRLVETWIRQGTKALLRIKQMKVH